LIHLYWSSRPARSYSLRGREDARSGARLRHGFTVLVACVDPAIGSDDDDLHTLWVLDDDDLHACSMAATEMSSPADVMVQ
jgi:hypothetical protein